MSRSPVRCTLLCLLLCCALGSGCGRPRADVAIADENVSASDENVATPSADATSASSSDVETAHHHSSNVDPTSVSALIVPDVLKETNYIGPLADAYRRIDPKSDGWDSEAFGEVAMAQLGLLAKRLIADDVKADELVTETFAAPDVWNRKQLSETFRDRCIVVLGTEQTLAIDNALHGTSKLEQLVSQFRGEFADHPHVKFKLYRVDAEKANVETMAYFHADGQIDGGRKEITGTFNVVWEQVTAERPRPRIHEIQIEKLEIVETSNDGAPLFADCTTSVLGDDMAYQQQLLRSTDHWRSHLCRDYGLDVVANHGMAIGDVNGDMLEDVYVCQQGGLPNRLFVQQPDGTLRDVSAESQTDWLDYSASALLIDLDNDGDKDLVVGHEQNIILMSNDGSGKFETRFVQPSRSQTFSLAAADYDSDGDLDVYCCGYNNLADRVRTGAMGEPIPYHDAQNGGPNMLLQNDGDWEFADVAQNVGLDQNNNRFSFAASWEDYDNDGDLDLYVSNDYGRNNLYQYTDGRFQDVAARLNVEDMSAGMSISWGDANRDGWMDFYVSNMFSAAGNRITYQRQFKGTTSDDTRKQFQRHARGNSLFQADGLGGFRDVSEAAGVTMGRWAWGSTFCDINNDGWQDIVVNNGFISAEDTGDL